MLLQGSFGRSGISRHLGQNPTRMFSQCDFLFILYCFGCYGNIDLGLLHDAFDIDGQATQTFSRNHGVTYYYFC